MDYYNHTTIELKQKGATSIAIKGANSPVYLLDCTDDSAVWDVGSNVPGEYIIQYFKGDNIIKSEVISIKQNLKFVSANFDPRSPARIVLDAIQAHLAGVSTGTQRRVKVGDKQIEYATYDQLMKYRNYYQKLALKEEGKASSLRLEKLYWKGGTQ